MKKVGNMEKTVFVDVNYKFPSVRTASKEIISEIEQIECVKLDRLKKKAIEYKVKKYKSNKNVAIKERTAFNICRRL